MRNVMWVPDFVFIFFKIKKFEYEQWCNDED